MPTFILAFALQCFFPIFDNLLTEFLGMSLVNREEQSKDYVVTAVGINGDASSQGVITLPAGRQRAFLLKDVLPAVPSSGSIRIEPVETGCTAYATSGNENVLGGAEGISTPSGQWLVPYVEVNTGFTELDHTDTTVAIVNAALGSASVRSELFGLDGVSRGFVNVQIAGGGTRIMRVSEAFRDVLPDNRMGGRTFRGYIRLTSEVGITAWQRMETPLSRNILRGQSLQHIPSTAQAYIPHFAFGSVYASYLNVVNPTPVPLDLELTAMDDAGRVLGSAVKVTLAPGEGRRASVDGFFGIPIIAIFPPPLITGMIRIREAAGRSFQIAGNVEIATVGTAARESSMLSPITSLAATSWTLPAMATTIPHFTAYAIVNPDSMLTVQTDVVVEAIGVDGQVVDRTTVSLAPGNRTARYVTIPNRTGYVRVRSNFPIHVLGAIGTVDNATLEQLPAVPSDTAGGIVGSRCLTGSDNR